MTDDQSPALDPVVELLRQRLDAPEGGGNQPLDPALGLVTEYLEQRRRQLEEDLARQQADDELRRDDAAVADARRELVQTVRVQIGELAAEFDRLRERIDVLAAALGACSECWGDDRGCRWCRGRGAPGFIPPEPEEFAHLVVPAVRMHARLVRLKSDDLDEARVETGERRSA